MATAVVNAGGLRAQQRRATARIAPILKREMDSAACQVFVDDAVPAFEGDYAHLHNCYAVHPFIKVDRFRYARLHYSSLQDSNWDCMMCDQEARSQLGSDEDSSRAPAPVVYNAGPAPRPKMERKDRRRNYARRR